MSLAKPQTNSRLKNSDACFKTLKDFTPNGSQTLSKMPCRFAEGTYPKALLRGLDSRVWDYDGNEYVDTIAGLGAVSLGYCNPQVNKAVENQLNVGVSFSLPNHLEALVARELCNRMPWTEQWKFGKNGTDATLMAIRAARAITGKERILVSGYHGCSDHFESLGIRKAGMLDLSMYTHLYTGGMVPKFDYACLITEPDTCDLKKASEWCRQYGVLLIVDEIITGGRTERFTQCNIQGVAPDFICVGKGLANGFPLSAIGGKREFMAVFERPDFFASMTFGGECASLAAAMATLPQLDKVIPQMVRYGREIQDYFNVQFQKATCTGYPTRLLWNFPSKEHKTVFFQEMCKRGILLGHSGFVMGSYTEQDVAQILSGIKEVSHLMFKDWVNIDELLEGPVYEDAVRAEAKSG